MKNTFKDRALFWIWLMFRDMVNDSQKKGHFDLELFYNGPIVDSVRVKYEKKSYKITIEEIK